jgi:uncharacterized protein
VQLYQFRREPAAFEDGNMADRRFLYLHGFASGPNSSKARYFRDRFAALGIPLDVLDLEQGDFAGLTLSGMLRTIRKAAADTPAVLIGSSLGGYLAALYAARHSEVERLVLLAPAFRFPTHYPATLGEAKLVDWRTSGRLPVFHYAAGEERDLGYDFYLDGIRYEPEPDVRQPTLIAHGRLDEVVPPAFSIEWARGRPDVELHLVESGHSLLEALDPIWKFTATFLAIEAAGT